MTIRAAYRIYVAALVAAAGAVFAGVLKAYPVHAATSVALLAVFAMAAENASFSLPVGGTVSLSFGIVYAAVLLSGPAGGGAVALAIAANKREFKEHKPVVIMLFNGAQIALSAMLAGCAYVSLHGKVMDSGPATPSVVIIPALSAAAVFLIANVCLVGVGFALNSDLSIREVFGEQRFFSYGMSLLVLALLGLMLAELQATAGWAAAVLVAIPFVLAQKTFRVYQELSLAYKDTVRSLIRAIEAKDAYTRGHSERVAEYSCKTYSQLYPHGRELEKLEMAALLHDIGKVGIERSILQKPGELTAEEKERVRLHPQEGGNILKPIELLEDVVPLICAHHEKIDGTGYPAGLKWADIPMLARILAVADSYDAMTSNRPYRDALTRSEALIELRRVAGSQLDDAIVEGFIHATTASGDGYGSQSAQ